MARFADRWRPNRRRTEEAETEQGTDQPTTVAEQGAEQPTTGIGPAAPVPPALEEPTSATQALPVTEQPTTEHAAIPPEPEPGQDAEAPEAPEEEPASAPKTPGFGQRSKLRRRLRYLRQARELGFRDLGGFVFDANRFARDRPDIVSAKLEALDAMDRELRAIETALDERQDLTVLREAGIAVCARCGVLHGSDARYCPHCGLQVGARVDLPLGPNAAPPPAQQQQQPPPPGPW